MPNFGTAQAQSNIGLAGTADANTLGRFWYHSNTYGDLYAWEQIANNVSTGTSIQGFASLAGVNPADLAINLGTLTLNSVVQNANNTVTEFYTGSTFTLSGGGISVAGNNVSLNIVTDKATDVATGYGQVTLTGAGNDAFFQEVAALTGGSPMLNLSITHFDPVAPLGADSYRYSSQGALTVVPEPSSLILFGMGCAMWAGYRRNRHHA